MAADWAPARGIYEILKAAGLGNNPSWELGYAKLTDSPDNLLIVRNVGGRSAEPNVAIDYPSVQLLCRAARGAGNYDIGYAKMVKARDALVGIPNALAYPELDSCIQIGHIQDLPNDDKDRPMWSLNLQLIVSYPTSGFREAV